MTGEVGGRIRNDMLNTVSSSRRLPPGILSTGGPVAG
jgi:hypothetical protein